MKIDEFDFQMRRLKDHFGDTIFSKERLKLVWTEVRDLQVKDFAYCVSVMIGENAPAYPPRVSEFRDFANACRKRDEKRMAEEAAKKWKSLDNGRERQGEEFDLDQYLKGKGVTSILDAIFKKPGGSIE